MLRNDERWVVYMEASFRWSHHEAPDSLLNLDGLRKILLSAVNTEVAIQALEEDDDNEAIVLDSVSTHPKTKPKFLVLLFSYVNRKGADPGFKDIKTRKSRVETKKGDEGVAASAHLLVSLRGKKKGNKIYYPALIEDVTGLGKTKMQQAVTKIIRRKKNFSFSDGDGGKRSALPTFEMSGLDDEQVTEDASKGRLGYFVLIKERRDKPLFDESVDAVVTREEIKLKPSDTAVKGLKAKLVKLAKAASGRGYDKVRVQYVREDGKNRSITFGTHREDSEDFLIKRIEKIKLSKTTVSQIYTKPCDELVGAMADLLK